MKLQKLIFGLGTALLWSAPAWAAPPAGDAKPAAKAVPAAAPKTPAAKAADDKAAEAKADAKADPRALEAPSDDTNKPLRNLAAAGTSSSASSGPAAPFGEPGSTITTEEAQPGSPPTAAEVDAAASGEEQLKMIEREGAYYEAGENAFNQDVKDSIKLQYNTQKELLAAQYDRAVDQLEQQERARRLDAIARFEEFLRKYPNDPAYTPDAMFRLAELYFERSSDEYLASSKGYEKQLAAYERGERPDEPPAPEPHYEKVIGLHQELLSRFPNYRLADAAEYLVGYCYTEQNQPDEALKAFLSLTNDHPSSKFLAEVWTRIGEIYFDRNEKDALSLAINAYRKVLEHPDSPYYDKALYKIAWAYYRLDHFPEAVAAFIRLVQYADEQKAKTGKTGSELRSEAIQYVAVSLADEDWGGLPKAREILEPYGDKPFVGEVWKRYGEILADQTRYDQAILVFEYTLSKHPDAPYDPEIQAKIVQAYDNQRNFDGATEAREKLVKNYSEGSTWFAANRENREAIAKARELTERSLFTAALFRHKQAQAFKAEKRFDDAKRSYQAAATAYKSYLAQFPNDKHAYDFEFFLAECLFYSENYVDAAKQYDKVRDSTVDNSHLEAAALSSVITYQKEVEHEEKSGKVPQYATIKAADRKGKKPEPKPVEPVYQQLVDASDRYVRLVPTGKEAPQIAYRAAEVFYRHDQMDEARRRFDELIQRSPSSDVARYAGNLIIESYLAVGDYDHVYQESQRLAALTSKAPLTGDAKDKKEVASYVEDLQKFKVGAEFKRAEQFDNEGRFEEAANTYVSLVNETPKHEFADKSLFNAAVDYEKVKRFETASNVYQRIVDEYPKSELAPRALFRVGVNYEKGYDFPAAIAAYNKLVDKYPNSENRADALYNEAVTLDNMQQYAQAAQAFKKYATTFEKRDDAGENFYRAATVYEKMKDWPNEIDTLKSFIGKYKAAPNQKERIVEAYLKIGKAYQEQGNERDALIAFNNTVKEYNSRHLPVDNQASASAAKATFEIAEADFRKYDALKITGTGRAQATALQNKARLQQQVQKEYTDVFRFKRADTTLAASYRIGYSYQRFAQAMLDAEVPKEFKDQDVIDEYRRQLEDKASVLDKKAEIAYRKAQDEAAKTHVTNEWTERTLEELNKYQPKEFPVQRSGKPALQTVTISGHGLDTLAPPPAKLKPSASGETKPAGRRTAEAEGGR